MNIEAVLPNFLGFDLVRCYLGPRLSLTFPQLDMFFFCAFPTFISFHRVVSTLIELNVIYPLVSLSDEDQTSEYHLINVIMYLCVSSRYI